MIKGSITLSQSAMDQFNYRERTTETGPAGPLLSTDWIWRSEIGAKIIWRDTSPLRLDRLRQRNVHLMCSIIVCCWQRISALHVELCLTLHLWHHAVLFVLPDCFCTSNVRWVTVIILYSNAALTQRYWWPTLLGLSQQHLVCDRRKAED